MGRFWERFCPYIIATIICFVLHFLNVENFEVKRLEFILNSVITFSVTYIGFVITSITILVGFSEKRIFKFLKNNGYTNLITEYFLSSIIIGTILILYSFYLGYSVGSDNVVGKFYIILFVGFFISFLISLIRISLFMLRIFSISQDDSILSKPSNKPSKVDKDKPFSNNIEKLQKQN